ncbi:MAG: hypothetical protein KDC79_13875 [Cyclobacteriaceae bacterium]|nr:hypothetical protein [Cyclobacteriaceae bacterium]
MNPVYYLSYSDSPRNYGLVFPSELQEDTYSPGIWVVAQNYNGYENEFIFDAVDKGELISLNMVRIGNSVFQVSTANYGKIFFRIRSIHWYYNMYTGNSNLIKPGQRLLQVVPMDYRRLENLCREELFFFVGKVDNDLMRLID